MALNYAKLFNRRVTPQSRPIPGSTQVANSGGGYSWQVDDWTRLDRFLILGAEGGTYYITERDLVKQNHDAIVRCIKLDGIRAVKRIVEISDSGRAPKNDPAVFALALVAAHGLPEAKALAFQNLAKVCRIGTHLFHFAEYVNALRGWGRGLRNAVGRWYLKQEADKLGYQVVKYQQRDSWSHGDLLRLAHPKAPSAEHEAVFRWILAGVDGLGERAVKRKVNGEDRVATYAPAGKPTCHSCEDFIHKTWTHNELRDDFNMVEKIQADPRFQKFLRWLYTQQEGAFFRTRRNRNRTDRA